MKNDKPVVLLTIIMIIGLILFIFFFIDDIKEWGKTKDYIETIGIFVEADYAPTADDGTEMYFLNYKYFVEGETYYFRTDYKTSIVPKIGSQKEIKYNPENPLETYIKGFSTATIFQVVGIFFFFIPLAMLCNKEITSNISIFIWSSLIIIYCIYGELYQSLTGIIFMIIPFIMNFACIMSFFEYVKNNKEKKYIEPIKNYEHKMNGTKCSYEYENNKEEYTDLKKVKVENKNKIKVILLSIVLFSLIPLDIFIESKGWFPSETIYTICSVISAFSALFGFIILGLYLTSNGNGKKIITVGGVEIRNDYVEKFSDHQAAEEYIRTLRRNILTTFLRSCLALPFIIVFFIVSKDASEVDKAGIYTFLLFFIIILYSPTLFHFIRYIKVKKNNKKM